MKNLLSEKTNKRGMTSHIENLIAVVIVVLLVAFLAPVALSAIFNTTAFAGVPTWAVTILGILAIVAFIYIMLNVARGKSK